MLYRHACATLACGLAATAAARAAGPYERLGWVADLPPGAHQARAVVTVLDERSLRVEHLTYDGTAPLVYFHLGAIDDDNAFRNGLRLEPELDRAYGDEALTLHLPPDETLDDYVAISIWCAEFHVNFSSASFDPPATSYARAGWVARFPEGFHNVQGQARIINDHLIHVTGFTYDGTAPAAYFYLGAANSDAAFASGLQLPPQLRRAYDDEALVLTLPGGESLDDFAAVSVWCAAVNVNFSSNWFRADGDFDLDGDVDAADQPYMLECVNGPDVTAWPPACAKEDFAHADLDADRDVDLHDVACFARLFTGGL